MPAGLLRLRKPSVVIRKKEEGRRKREEGRRKKEEGRGKKATKQCTGFNGEKEAGKRKMRSFEIACLRIAKANVTCNAKAVLSEKV
ncbi:hypothetical protein QUA82_10260 [Microcoleus sp. F8-D3]